MKTYNKLKGKSLARKLGTLTLTLLLAASCGSDKNESSSSTDSSVSLSTLSSNDSNFGSDWSNLKSSISCNSTYGRSSDRYYYTTGNSSTMSSGSMSGTTNGSWLGTNSDGHAVAVQKVVSSGTTYYNVVISACVLSSTNYGTTYSILGDDDTITNASFSNFNRAYAESYGLDCSHDFLAYGTFTFSSSNYSSLGYGSGQIVFGTNYYSATCY